MVTKQSTIPNHEIIHPLPTLRPPNTLPSDLILLRNGSTTFQSPFRRTLHLRRGFLPMGIHLVPWYGLCGVRYGVCDYDTRSEVYGFLLDSVDYR